MSVRVRRAAAQLLHRPGRAKADAVVRRLLAVQAQDLRSARLALRARAEEPRAADVDAALTDERSLVVGWLGRGTLHLSRVTRAAAVALQAEAGEIAAFVATSARPS